MVNKSKRNFILVFGLLAISEILASVYNIASVYGKMFLSGNAASVALALFEVIIIDGILGAVITWVISSIYFLIVRRYTAELEKDKFVLTVMLFTMFANLVLAVIFAFNFLDSGLYVFAQYICPIIVNCTAFAFMVHLSILKNTNKKREVFIAMAVPYFIWKLIGYFGNVVLYLTYKTNGDLYSQLGLVLTFDPNEKLAIILGAVALAVFIIYLGIVYLILSKHKNNDDNAEITGKVEDTKIFDDFDI